MPTPQGVTVLNLTYNVILASASPRRQELLKNVFAEFKVEPSNAEENVPKDVSAENTAEYLAKIKAEAVASAYPDDMVIGADTCVVVDSKILGKPKDIDDARQMLRLLSGRTHKVITGCAVVKEGATTSFSVETEVEFYPLDMDEIEEYIKTSEPYDKAGGYGIQGKASLFVKGIRGDYYNVVGLPLAELNKRLKTRS